MVVEVLGTAFNVTDRNSTTQSQVVVQEGTVAVSTSDASQKIELSANEVAIYASENNTLGKSNDPSLNSIAWFTKSTGL